MKDLKETWPHQLKSTATVLWAVQKGPFVVTWTLDNPNLMNSQVGMYQVIKHQSVRLPEGIQALLHLWCKLMIYNNCLNFLHYRPHVLVSLTLRFYKRKPGKLLLYYKRDTTNGGPKITTINYPLSKLK